MPVLFLHKCVFNEIDLIAYTRSREGTCDLFPQEAIQGWEERINPRQVLGQIPAEFFAQHVHACPNCGQYNAKVT
jgi:E3 ubiquitin-protein ligase RNF14